MQLISLINWDTLMHDLYHEAMQVYITQCSFFPPTEEGIAEILLHESPAILQGHRLTLGPVEPWDVITDEDLREDDLYAAVDNWFASNHMASFDHPAKGGFSCSS